MLGTVENPIRRKIIARLSQRPNYQLQLSRELDISQQLVAKHLGNMEEAGLVSTVLEDSPRGPQRKEYLLKKSFSITIDLAPSLFKARMFSFGAVPGLDPDEQGQMMTKASEALKFQEEANRAKPLAQIIDAVDRKLSEMEEQRAVLLYLRGLALRESTRVATAYGTTDKRQVLRYIMREQKDGLEDISLSLGLHRRVVGSILEEMERDLSVE